MALDIGDTPDWIDPQKKRKIQQQRDPFSENPAWPQQKPARRAGPPYQQEEPPARPDPTNHYGELVASHVYPAIMQKVQHYTGRNPRQLNPQQLLGTMQQSLMQAMQMEQPHKEELEQAAVRVVLGLPEFRDAAAAIQHGTLRIDAQLVHPMAMQRAGQLRAHDQPAQEDPEEEPEQDQDERRRAMHVDPEEPEEEQAQEMGLQVPQIRQEYDEEAHKRRFVNMLIQGAAINKNYAYHEIADELRAINPQILNLYGRAMSIAELVYWMMPEEDLNQMMGMSGPGGTEEISYERGEPDLGHAPELPGEGGGEGGGQEGEAEQELPTIATIHARGICFPVLVQEIVKGLYEFLSFTEDDPDEVREYGHGKADTLANEQWDIMQGPGIWRHLNHLVNQANGAEYMGRVFRHLVTLPTGQFNQLMREILAETPTGRDYIRRVVAEIREEGQGQQNENKARKLFPDH
jgi:hypothetical protein